MPDSGGRFSRLVRSRQAALGLIILGVVVIAAGLLQTTTSHLKGGNLPCPIGTTLVAKFGFGERKYHFESPAGNEHVVTITHGSETGGTWDSQIAIADIIVKGGSNAKITSFAPPSLHGQFSNAGLPLVGKGNHPDISNIQFCAPIGNPTTTTSTSTVPHSTTTTHATTTTTVTVPSSTTTTETPPATEGTTVVPPTEPPTVPPTEPPTVAPTTTTTTTETSPATEATTVPNGSSTAAGATSTVPGSTTPRTVFESGVTSTTIVPAPTDARVGSGSLPRTGSPSLPLIALGTLLLAAGAALVIVGRRRHWA